MMEMTISDYIKIIKNWLYKGTDGLTNTKLGYIEGWFHKTDKEAFETAIDIMNKYRKIEQIIKDHDDDRMPDDYWYIDKIREVIEDGNAD